MAYLTDDELLERFEYYTVQLEKKLMSGEDFQTVVDQVPFGVHLNDCNTLEMVHVNSQLEEIIGYHNDEVRQMGTEYLENYLHPKTLANISQFLPPLYREMKSHETFPFMQYVLLHKDRDFSPFITFTKSTSYGEGLVICLSLRSTDLEKMAPRMEQVVEMDGFKMKHFRRFQKLTEREIEILRLLANGYNNPMIAERLFISRSTVETHRKKIKRKLKLESFHHLMKYAFAFELIEC